MGRVLRLTYSCGGYCGGLSSDAVEGEAYVIQQLGFFVVSESVREASGARVAASVHPWPPWHVGVNVNLAVMDGCRPWI